MSVARVGSFERISVQGAVRAGSIFFVRCYFSLLLEFGLRSIDDMCKICRMSGWGRKRRQQLCASGLLRF